MAKKKSQSTAPAIAESQVESVVTEVAVEASVAETTTEVAPEAAPAAGKKMPSLSEDLSAASKEISEKKTVSPGRVAAEGDATSKKFDKYNVSIAGTQVVQAGSKISMVVAVLRHALENGMSQSELNESKFVATFPLLRDFPEGSSTQHIRDELAQHKARYATKEDKHIIHSKSVMVVCNQWYPANAEKFVTAMCERFPDITIEMV